MGLPTIAENNIFDAGGRWLWMATVISNYGKVKRGMCTGPVCLIGAFALENDIETTGPVEIVNR